MSYDSWLRVAMWKPGGPLSLTRPLRLGRSLRTPRAAAQVDNFICFNGLRKRAGRRQAPVERNGDSPFKRSDVMFGAGGCSRRGRLHTCPGGGGGGAGAVVQHLLAVSDSNRDPLKDEPPGQLASG